MRRALGVVSSYTGISILVERKSSEEFTELPEPNHLNRWSGFIYSNDLLDFKSKALYRFSFVVNSDQWTPSGLSRPRPKRPRDVRRSFSIRDSRSSGRFSVRTSGTCLPLTES